MKFYKVFKLKNGEELIIENAKIDDAEELTIVDNTTLKETKYSTRGEDDPLITVEDSLGYIKDELESEKTVLLVARYKGKIVGDAHIEACLFKKRVAHRCDIGLSVLKNYWGLGIGGRLMSSLIECSITGGYEQIELSVAETNERAYRMYKSFGFIETGKSFNEIKYEDGTYENYIQMVKFLKEQKKVNNR